jgi:hypothetical protein
MAAGKELFWQKEEWSKQRSKAGVCLECARNMPLRLERGWEARMGSVAPEV